MSLLNLFVFLTTNRSQCNEVQQTSANISDIGGDTDTFFKAV